MRKLFKLVTMTFILSVIVNFSNAQCIKTSCNGSSNTGTYSSAIGYQTNSTGNYAFSSGYKSAASGISTTALGDSSIAKGNFSFAAGCRSVTTKFKSVALGENCLTKEVQSYAIGQNCITNASQSLAIGRYMQTNASGAIALGSSTSQGPLVNGINNSLMIGFNSTVPTLFVGPSPDYKSSGNVGIGTTAPTQKLDIDGNIRLRNNAIIGTWSNNSLSFYTNSATRMVISPSGDVGIGTSLPDTKLHIDGDITVSGLANEKGDQIVTSDRNGKLMLIPVNFSGDNLGNHIATQNLSLGEYGLTYNLNNEAGLKITKTNDIFIAKNMSVNENISVKGGIFGYAPAGNDNWNKLQIFGSTLPDAAKIEVCDGSGDHWRSIKFITKGNTADYQFLIDSKMSMRIRSNKVEMGSDTIPTALNVYGIINAREVKVSLGSWSDYVFEPGYKLRFLSDVEDFILNNGHLPDIPSASTVLENGVNLGEMDALLLRKIEELTLYVIELQKNNDKMKGEIESLKTNLLTTQN